MVTLSQGLLSYSVVTLSQGLSLDLGARGARVARTPGLLAFRVSRFESRYSCVLFCFLTVGHEDLIRILVANLHGFSPKLLL